MGIQEGVPNIWTTSGPEAFTNSGQVSRESGRCTSQAQRNGVDSWSLGLTEEERLMLG